MAEARDIQPPDPDEDDLDADVCVHGIGFDRYCPRCEWDDDDEEAEP